MTEVKTIFHGVHDGRAVWERWQDCEPAVDLAKQMSDEATKLEWGRPIGCIPNVVIERWMVEDGVNVLGMGEPEFRAYIRKKLADPDNRKFVVKY